MYSYLYSYSVLYRTVGLLSAHLRPEQRSSGAGRTMVVARPQAALVVAAWLVGAAGLVHGPGAHPIRIHRASGELPASPEPPAVYLEGLDGERVLVRRAGPRIAMQVAMLEKSPSASSRSDSKQAPGKQKRLRAMAADLQRLPRSADVGAVSEILNREYLDTRNLTSLLVTFKRRHKWRLAWLIAQWAERPDCPVPFTTMHYNLLMGASVRRAPKRALQIFAQMRIRSIETNVVTHNSAMAASLALNDPRAALGTFDEMKSLGIEPSTISYNTAISACARTGDAELALALFREMEADGVERTTVTYTGLIHACAEAMQLDKAMALFT